MDQSHASKTRNELFDLDSIGVQFERHNCPETSFQQPRRDHVVGMLRESRVMNR